MDAYARRPLAIPAAFLPSRLANKGYSRWPSMAKFSPTEGEFMNPLTHVGQTAHAEDAAGTARQSQAHTELPFPTARNANPASAANPEADLTAPSGQKNSGDLARAKELLGGLRHECAGVAKDYAERARASIRARPLAALGTAIAVGIVMGRVTR
jgi:ElaB/YqjD/DUF883 family membrane-anchored ribosome-binding protein